MVSKNESELSSPGPSIESQPPPESSVTVDEPPEEGLNFENINNMPDIEQLKFLNATSSLAEGAEKRKIEGYKKNLEERLKGTQEYDDYLADQRKKEEKKKQRMANDIKMREEANEQINESFKGTTGTHESNAVTDPEPEEQIAGTKHQQLMQAIRKQQQEEQRGAQKPPENPKWYQGLIPRFLRPK